MIGSEIHQNNGVSRPCRLTCWDVIYNYHRNMKIDLYVFCIMTRKDQHTKY